MEKTYTALVYGDFASERDADGFIEYDPESTVRKKRRFVAAPSSPSAQTAMTKLRPLARTAEFSLVEAILATGRTHQIRATLFSLVFPLVGDKLYGPDDTIFLRNRTDELTTEDRKKLILPRQALHARKLTLRNTAGKRLSFESPAPDFLAEAAAFRADLKTGLNNELISLSGRSLILPANSEHVGGARNLKRHHIARIDTGNGAKNTVFRGGGFCRTTLRISGARPLGQNLDTPPDQRQIVTQTAGRKIVQKQLVAPLLVLHRHRVLMFLPTRCRGAANI